MATVDPAYLIPFIRLNLGDINPVSYRYTNEWIKVAIEGAVKALSGWWNAKYIIDPYNSVSRNSLVYGLFSESEPPVIEPRDERIIILMSTIVILEGSLENSAWNLASWKDNEISYSNLEGGRIRDKNLQRLWDELLYLTTPPTRKLARTVKSDLPGYLNNDYERTTQF